MKCLFDYINRYASTSISEEDFEIFRHHFIAKKIRKRQYFLQEGEVCKYTAFIVSGAMRKYYVDEKGSEHIVELYMEDWWASDRESFILNTPSVYNIDAWEDCDVYLITKESMVYLTQEFPAFNELRLKLDERNTIAAQKRITSSISFMAEKRYEDFAKSHPHFLQRFPQHIIASYLGITKDTLSRVRKKALRG